MPIAPHREPIGLAEERRLRSLYDLDQLEAPDDPLLQALVDEAAALFDAPIAAIGLVDRNHQIFRARHGLDLAETNRSCSFSTHAIQDEGVYEIVDMESHDIYAANPLVLGAPHVRYYCAAPLQLDNGRRIGAIAIIDNVERAPASEAQKAALTRLAAKVVARMMTPERKTTPKVSMPRSPSDKRFASLCGSLIAA